MTASLACLFHSQGPKTHLSSVQTSCMPISLVTNQFIDGISDTSLHMHGCTGNSGSGQGLFKTPDDPVSQRQGALLARMPPAGLANMQSPWMAHSSLALPSPWNTPALPQPPIPQPSEPASIRKPAGKHWMLQWCACHPIFNFSYCQRSPFHY